MTTGTAARTKPEKNAAERSFASRVWYETVRVVVGAFALGLFRLRCAHRDRFPATGGFLLLSNHQSHLDPPFVGLIVPRRVNFVARDTLFKNRFFAWLINSLDAIPIDREGLGLAGLKETMRRLKRGEIVLLFPEGTRSPDGEMQPLRPGFSALVHRTGVPIVPVALDGAFQAWPRNAKLPRPGRIQIVVGEPISTETAKGLDDRALVSLVDERIRACLAEARAMRDAR